MLQIRYKKHFTKKFKKLPSKIKTQFYRRLEVFHKNQFDPVLNKHSVDRAFPDCRSINITGDYRAILMIEADLVIFITIGTHSELY